MPTSYDLVEVPYYRDQAVAYANYWAYRRNPNYYSFDQIGGDCTNFVSQALYAANGVMNFTPTYGWYYLSIDDRAPAWTGVVYLYNFLTTNKGAGPFGHEVPLEEVMPGDVIQMDLNGEEFGHSVIVTSIRGEANPTYNYYRIRAIHIDGVRYFHRGETARPNFWENLLRPRTPVTGSEAPPQQ